MSLQTDIAAAVEQARTEPDLTVKRLALWISDAAYRSNQLLLNVDFTAAFIGSSGLLAADTGTIADAIIRHFGLDKVAQ